MARLRLCCCWPSRNWAILRFLVKGIGVARLRRLFRCRSVCNSERSARARGRPRGELKTVRPGAATRERFLEGEGKKRFGVVAERKPRRKCVKNSHLRRKSFCASIECPEKNVCDLNDLTTDLRLRLLSSTKLVISRNGHGSRHAPDGRARKRSVEGIPVPVEGRE